MAEPPRAPSAEPKSTPASSSTPAPRRSPRATSSTRPRSTAGCRPTSPATQGPLEVRQFKGGQSNPTYQLVTPGKKYVMRRKPPGKLLPSAHAVDREYRVITALYPTGFPVAKTYGLCVDDARDRHLFYVMDMVEGRILWDQSLPQYTPAERHADLHGPGEDARRPAQHRLQGHRPRGLRPHRQLHGPPDRPLDQAVQGLRDPAHRHHRAADRVAAEDLPGRTTRPRSSTATTAWTTWSCTPPSRG